MAERVADAISRPASERTEQIIEDVLPRLRKLTPVLKQTEKGAIVDIIRHCDYVRSRRDDVLIRQGTVGECYYILLQGSVSVYIDAVLMDGDKSPVSFLPGLRNPDDRSACSAQADEADQQLDVQVHRSQKKKATVRSRLGKFIVRFDAGKGFGELALLGDDNLRNASVISDEDCHLMAMGRELFNRCLKAEQEEQLHVVRTFVRSHPFLCSLPDRIQRVLEMSLRKEKFTFDTTIVRQGDPVTGLYFVQNGQSKITIEPGRHKSQYPQMWPFVAWNDLMSQEFEWLRESRRNAILRKYCEKKTPPTRADHVTVRRTEGYAAMEKRMLDKSVTLCTIENNEAIGDTEILLGLDTYMQTCVSTSDTTIFFLDLKSLERVVIKRHPFVLDRMKRHLAEKLEIRQNMKQADHVPLLKFLNFKLNEEAPPAAKKLPPLKTTKAAPDRETEMLYLLLRFREGRAPLLDPYIPGSLYYKELMHEKARVRENVRLHKGVAERGGDSVGARRTRWRARSVREIREAVRQQIDADVARIKEKEWMSQRLHSDSLGPLRKKSRCTIEKSDRVEEPAPGTLSPARSPTFAAFNNLMCAVGSRRGLEMKEKEANVGDKARFSQLRSAGLQQRPDEIFVTRPRETGATTLSPVPEEVADLADDQLSSESLDYDSEGIFPEEEEEEEEEEESLWDPAKKIVEARVRKRLRSHRFCVTSVADNYETSDISLDFLESRIKAFHIKNGRKHSFPMKLPKLKRYREDEESPVPRPGGRVWIKKKVCRYSGHQIHVKNHDHVRYHMVPSLPQFQNVLKKRLVLQNWLSRTATSST